MTVSGVPVAQFLVSNKNQTFMAKEEYRNKARVNDFSCSQITDTCVCVWTTTLTRGGNPFIALSGAERVFLWPRTRALQLSVTLEQLLLKVGIRNSPWEHVIRKHTVITKPLLHKEDFESIYTGDS